MIARLAFVIALVLAILAHGVPAWAEDPMVAARAAYTRGAEAFDREDWAAAARAFAEADALVPNARALKHALKAAIHDDDPIFGMTLVDRARRWPDDAELTDAALRVEKKFRARVGQVEVVCPGECAVVLDGQPLARDARPWLAAGDHTLELTVDGRWERRTVNVVGGRLERIEITAGPRGPEPFADPATKREAPSKKPLSPVWFWSGVVLTAVAAGFTVASGLDALDKNRTYQDGDDSARAGGVAAQTRTNVLLAGTGAALATTTLLAVFAVDW